MASVAREMTFEDLKRLLFVRGNFGVKLGLDRMFAALALLGDPHLCAPVLHVAGTNGKGSTCAFAAAALQAARLRVGLYTSPHLVHFCERIRIDGAPISEERAAALLGAILQRVPWALAGGPGGASDGDGLTFFELATLMGFLAFAEAGVSAMVVEVGLGGRLDATNVVRPLACAIAPLGLEHQEYLGETLAAIAAEKAGIIKAGAPVATAAQPPEAGPVVEEAAARAGVALWRPGREYDFGGVPGGPMRYHGPRWSLEAPLALAGAHQRGNAALACALLEAAAGRGLPVGPREAARGLSQASWPGRLQRVSERPLLLIDGAHNPHAARALVASLPELLEGRALQLVFGTLADKDAEAMLRALLPLCSGVHLCPPASPRAASPQALAGLARKLAPRTAVAEYQRAAEALAAARADAGPGGAVLCCGSLYLAGELLELVEGRVPVAMPAERL
jgi:dihydrofolate synthase/folylpolyglutamate synthase